MIGGLSGDRMLLGLAIGIIVLIFLVLKTKVQAFLALIISTIIVGVVGGMPLTNITLDDGKTFGIINSITTGFGGTLGSIGIIIGFGVMMGHKGPDAHHLGFEFGQKAQIPGQVAAGLSGRAHHESGAHLIADLL